MAPPKVVEHTVDRTPEYEKFIEELRVFHEKRGTNFDPEPKMGNISIDLLKVFDYVVQHGGYDKVSDEKLMWRKMCEGLGLMRHNAPADAYSLKQIFYKNLAAYEIKKVHNKEPPPPEILEFTTAKGGSLLTRTLENFQAKAKTDREESTEDGTPSRERRPEETPGSGRASRGLREAPAPRVIFHPDTNSSRQSRHASGQQPSAAASSSVTSQSHPASNPQSHPNTPTPVHPPSHHHQQHHPQANRGGASYMWNPPNMESVSQLVQSYQPPTIPQVQLRIVDTPSSNPDLFARKQRLRGQPPRIPPNTIGALVRQILTENNQPGALDGANIYYRSLSALRSLIPAEQAFGLNHLVKISCERGDRVKLQQFHGMAEGLTEVVLGAGNLFYHVDWNITYDPDFDPEEGGLGELDGINGTADILDRIAKLERKNVQDNFQPASFTDRLNMIALALLSIRNLSLLPDNAFYLTALPATKDMLVIILHLPDLDLTVEIKHLALEIAEQMTPYLMPDSDDPLYKTLLAQLESKDRGTILTALRAINRIAMSHPTETNKLGGVSPAILQSLIDWLMLNDDELMDACLDFLYQYTAVVPNLDVMIKGTNMQHLVTHLVRLLSHGAKRSHREIVVSEARLANDAPSEAVVPVPRDLLERLVSTEEPERCYTWVRCFFEEDPDSHITQIAIWQAYNTAFLEPLKRNSRLMINASEFIRNISTVYQSAAAQVIHDQPNGKNGDTSAGGAGGNKFIMRGIRPRAFPLHPDSGKGYFMCLWRDSECRTWHLTAEKMWLHILVEHLRETPGEDGQWLDKKGLYSCAWDGCKEYPKPTEIQLSPLMAHIKTHVCAEEERRAVQAAQAAAAAAESSGGALGPKRPHKRIIRPAKTISITYEETASARDERNPNAPAQAAGIPLSAVLILRNIARNIGKTEAQEELMKESREQGRDDGDESTVKPAGFAEQLFRPAMGRLWEIFCENRLLAPYLTSLFQLLDRADPGYSYMV